jgi:hypothetical protein
MNEPQRLDAPSFAFSQRRVGNRDRSFSAPKAGSPTVGGSRLETLFRFGGRQIVLAGHHLSTGLAFKFEPGPMGKPAAGLWALLLAGVSDRLRTYFLTIRRDGFCGLLQFES